MSAYLKIFETKLWEEIYPLDTRLSHILYNKHDHAGDVWLA